MSPPDDPDETANDSGVGITRRRVLRSAGVAGAAAAVGAIGFAWGDHRDGGEPTASTRSAPTTTGAPAPSVPVPPPTGRPAPSDGYLVTDFGATQNAASDGINRATAKAASDGGGTVVIPNGYWLLDKPLQVATNVTILGESLVSTVLRAKEASVVLRHSVQAMGTSVENVTVDGNNRATTGIAFGDGASYCSLRRVRVMNTSGSGIVLRGGDYERMYFEDLFVTDVGGNAVDVAVASATSMFVTGLAVAAFGRAASGTTYAVSLRGRAHMCEVDIEGVRRNQVGIGFLPGSEYSTLTGFYIQLAGGVAHTSNNVKGIAIGNGSIDGH